MAQHSTRSALIVRAAMICTLLMLSLLPTRFAAAATPIYVDPNGSDITGNGSAAAPYKTLQKAIYNNVPGVPIYMNTGTYAVADAIWWGSDRSGTSSAWIVVQPAPNATPVLECGSTATVDSCLRIAGQYIEIKGLEIKNSRKSGILVWGGSHVRLTGNTIYGSQNQGIYVSGEPGGGDDIVVDGNTVRNNALRNILPVYNAAGGWDAGISIQHQTTNVTVTNNNVYHNNGEGIGISAKVNTVVRGNLIHDNFSVNMYINGAHNATVERNFIYTSDAYQTPAQTTYYRYNAPANGISVSNENDLDATTLSGLTIRNNIVVGGRYAFYYGGYQRIAGGMKNSSISHNTFYTNRFYADSNGNSATVVIGLDKDSAGNPANNHVNTKFFNNAVMQVSAGAIRQISPAIPDTGVSFWHNAWHWPNNTPDPYGAGPGDVLGNPNPRFVNAGGLTAGANPQPLADFYKLTSASPLINAAASNGLTEDFWGDPRAPYGGTDIGADEYAPTVAFAQPSYTVMEGSPAVITIRLSQPMIEQVSVSYATSNGSAVGSEPCKGTCPTGLGDYPVSVGTVYFAAGQTQATISIPTYSDGVIEQNEYFRVTLSTPTTMALGTPSITTVYISDGNTENQ